MSLRIDLMREEEFRHQGAVSHRFIGFASGGFLAGLLLVGMGILIERDIASGRELAQLSGSWAEMSPRFERAKERRAELTKIQSYQSELKQWADTRMDWAARLDELNSLIPNSIQLTRLNVRCEWAAIKAPPPPPAPLTDKPDAAEKKKAPLPPPEAVPARKYYLSIAGRAAGESGGDQALGIVTKLKMIPGYGATFESIKLQNVVRDSVSGDLADRSFSIEGVTLPRRLE